MTAANLHAQIAARTTAAITETLDQLANGWTDHEVLVVAADAWAVIADLKDQAAAVEELGRYQLEQLAHGRIVDDTSARAELAA